MVIVAQPKSKGVFLGLLLISFFVWVLINFSSRRTAQFSPQKTSQSPSWWEIQSIDTMKFSRDLAREKMEDQTFDQVIEEQVKKIAQTGATHVAIATPYDREFLPFLQRWVETTRKYHLNVWFRGNWAGWEKWFGYPQIGREEHLVKTKEFVLENGDLFQDGDIFTACPECENGGPGDPRRTGDVAGHRAFLIEEYQISRDAFLKIGKKVRTNFNSMNGDVARLIMDQETTAALGGVVVVDHYVSRVDKLIRDLSEIALKSQGRVMLGEFGVPIIDIHGPMSAQAQAEWIEQAFGKLAQMPEVIGLNYWINRGGSSQLWNEDGTAQPAVEVISSFYTPQVISGVVQDQLGRPITKALVYSDEKETTTDQQGEFQLPYRSPKPNLIIVAKSFNKQEFAVNDPTITVETTLVKEHEDWLFKIRKFIHQLFF